MKLKEFNMKKMNLDHVDESYAGEDILMKLGELYQFESGIYGYGNIWTKLERKVEDIIIEELDKAGCIQVEFPKLQPRSVWDKSGRWNTYTKDNDIMFTLNNNLGEYGLAPTAEECATIFGANRLTSYKNLPATYYQISEKFRKEKRARGYLFRPRTFVMMDAYSFDKDEEGMRKTYDKMFEVYLNIFKRLHIPIVPTVSDNGTMGGKVSHEFQAILPLGEDTILYDEEKKVGINKEVLTFPNKDEYLKQLGLEDESSLKEFSSIELGNNFQLGTKYSKDMNLLYQDEKGEYKPYYMGCYGIGLGRIIATIIENSIIKENDKIKGLSLPFDLAPYKIQIIYKESKEDLANKVYDNLLKENISCIIDNRDDYSLGNRIKDAYVLGTPYIAIFGDKMEDNLIEVENTKTKEKQFMKEEELITMLKNKA